jgi:hypothetical protein
MQLSEVECQLFRMGNSMFSSPRQERRKACNQTLVAHKLSTFLGKWYTGAYTMLFSLKIELYIRHKKTEFEYRTA